MLPGAPSAPTAEYLFTRHDQPDARLFSLVTENGSIYNETSAFVPAPFPGGCSSTLVNNGIGSLTTSYPENIINPYGYETPAWYLPDNAGSSCSATSNLSDW